jgi:cell division protein FtsI (penicillin-binding protein 3)
MIADRIFVTSGSAWNGPIDSIAAVSKNRLVAQKASSGSYQALLRAMGFPMPQLPSDNVVTQLYTDSSRKITAEARHVYTGMMPDVTGMGLKDAVYLLEQQGIKVWVKGRGRVRVQSVPAGSRISKGQQIVLQLS